MTSPAIYVTWNEIFVQGLCMYLTLCILKKNEFERSFGSGCTCEHSIDLWNQYHAHTNFLSFYLVLFFVLPEIIIQWFRAKLASPKYGCTPFRSSPVMGDRHLHRRSRLADTIPNESYQRKHFFFLERRLSIPLWEQKNSDAYIHLSLCLLIEINRAKVDHINQ